MSDMKEVNVIRPPEPDPISPGDEETNEDVTPEDLSQSQRGGMCAGTIRNSGVPTSAEARHMLRAGDPDVKLVHAGQQHRVDTTRTPKEDEPYFKDIGIKF